MTRKQKRATLILSGLGILCVSVLLVMFALRDSIVFFHSPSDVTEKKVSTDRRFRLGGLVKEGSIVRGDGTNVRFAITDTIETIPVTYQGILPDLFREGEGVIAEGRLSDGVFTADTVLAKHDENYMPPEVAASLREKGVKLGKSAPHPGKDGASEKAN